MSDESGELAALAALVRARNSIDAEIAALMRRSAHTGHIAEYVVDDRLRRIVSSGSHYSRFEPASSV